MKNNNKFSKDKMNAMPIENEAHAQFTRRETREVITPFAFSIDQNLFGTAIASPWKRGAAMLIDLILIAILSSAGGEFLALAIAIAAFRFGSRKRAEQLGKVNGTKRRAAMRFIGALIIFVLLLQILPSMFNGSNPLDSDDFNSYDATQNYSEDGVIAADFNLGKTLELTGFIIKTVNAVKEKGCDQELSCWQEVLAPVPEQAFSFGLTEIQAADLFSEITSELPISREERQRLATELTSSYGKLVAQSAAKKPLNNDNGVSESESTNVPNTSEATITEAAKADPNHPVEEAKPSNQTDNGAGINGTEMNQSEASEVITTADTSAPAQTNAGKIKDKATKPIYSIVEYFKALIRDLGLGFGWAAFYFTVCGSMFNGKTPGKKLFGIRVIQLDGTRLSLWDSFGRYGGYGAGLATGLLGFVQIYWDANRQAIQDKISATVVIDERKIAAPELVAMARATHDKE
ncbi:RDD family protein [Thalassotalea litorea]|uniref:RDD family protein n=1 Tax=Thalassotalea litorea TaxID=2020715 RepID=A0A5R9IPN3_9GAMM|nr:RDD family protein [Thalassotalea litorea]TLU67504.1 RDD family protein [Thalassotalea litorea]